MVDESEHLFDKVIRIGYGIEICKYLWGHDLAALACVDRQCAEAIRWQREKGNIKTIWTRDINNHIIFKFKDTIVKIRFVIDRFEFNTYKINFSKKKKYKLEKLDNVYYKKLDKYNRIVQIYLSKVWFCGDDITIILNYEDAETILDSIIYFNYERYEQMVRTGQISKEEARKYRISAEEKYKKNISNIQVDTIRVE
jgi:hypothetical protein